MCEAKAPDEVRRKNESGRKCGERIKCSASRVLFEEPFESAHFIARVKKYDEHQWSMGVALQSKRGGAAS